MNRQEYFEQKHFSKLWKVEKSPQERPKSLIEMEVFDRNNQHFEILPKFDKYEAQAEACGYEKPEMAMGRRQVDVLEKKKQSDESSVLDIHFTKSQEPVFPKAPKDKSVAMIFGAIEGPPSKPKCVSLTDEDFRYYKSLTKQEQKKLPGRCDPSLPSAIKRHMLAHETVQYTDLEREYQKMDDERYKDEFQNIRKKFHQ